MAAHVAVLDKETGLVYDQAFCREPVDRKRWENLFLPGRADGIRPRIETSGLNTVVRKHHNEPRLFQASPEIMAKEVETAVHLTLSNHKPQIIERIGNDFIYA